MHAHNNLGVLLMKQGKWAESTGHFRAAITLAPKFALAHANLGRVLSLQGQNAAAVAELARS